MSEGAAGDLAAETETNNIPSPKKHHTLTVCMVPPPVETALWDRLTAARTELRDPGLYRWPPHVNLLYPFISIAPEIEEENEDSGMRLIDDDIVHRLRNATRQFEPFTVSLDSLGTFGGKQRGVLWLYPRSYSDGTMAAEKDDTDEPLIELQAKLEENFPTCTDQRKQGKFSPHMTISHFPSLESAQTAQTAIEAWWPTESCFRVDCIYLLKRKGDGGQFLRVATIPLGDESMVELHNPPEAFPAMPQEEEDWVREERKKMQDRRRRPWKNRRRKRGGQRRDRGLSKSTDTPEMIAAKRAERKAKRERLERERLEHESQIEGTLDG